MRYVTVLVYPAEGEVHPVARRLAEEPAVRRKAVHAVKEVPDGTIVLFTEIEGDVDRYGELMDASSEVITYATSGEDPAYCYVQVEGSPRTRRLLEFVQHRDFVVRMPIEYTADGGRRVTMVGREADFVDAVAEPPESIEMELVSTGEYHPDAEDVFADLTDRQREVLEAAIRMGYYENPRRATHEEIATEVGVEPGTVGKHLRNVESRVFSKYVL